LIDFERINQIYNKSITNQIIKNTYNLLLLSISAESPLWSRSFFNEFIDSTQFYDTLKSIWDDLL